jgi:anti-sigma factor RsiW
VNQGHLEEELLHRYFDGDLRGREASAVEQHLESCADCRAKEQALASLRGMIELAADDSARDVDFGALYSRIEQGIRAPQPAGLLERLAVWWRDLAEQKPAKLWVPAGMLAAAALLIAILRGGDEPERMQASTRPSPELEAAEQEDLARRAQPPREKQMLATVSSEIEQVDFGDSAGTVFEIALADGVSTPVVWINDDMQ